MRTINGGLRIDTAIHLDEQCTLELTIGQDRAHIDIRGRLGDEMRLVVGQGILERLVPLFAAARDTLDDNESVNVTDSASDNASASASGNGNDNDDPRCRVILPSHRRPAANTPHAPGPDAAPSADGPAR